MSEYAGADPRVRAAEDAADPPDDDKDATLAAEDPAAPDDDGAPDEYS
jgi:hypothetical protein